MLLYLTYYNFIIKVIRPGGHIGHPTREGVGDEKDEKRIVTNVKDRRTKMGKRQNTNKLKPRCTESLLNGRHRILSMHQDISNEIEDLLVCPHVFRKQLSEIGAH